MAKWRGDGKELFFLRDSTLTAVGVNGGASFEAGVPQPLFETPLTPGVFNKRYSVTRDGQRFLMPAPGDDSAATPATVVIDWMAGIRR